MPPELLSILPNLSIGVVSVIALAYISLRHADVQKKSQETFIQTLDKRADKNETSLQERETAMRDLEAEIRGGMIEQLAKNTIAFTEVASVMGRVVAHLDKQK